MLESSYGSNALARCSILWVFNNIFLLTFQHYRFSHLYSSTLLVLWTFPLHLGFSSLNSFSICDICCYSMGHSSFYCAHCRPQRYLNLCFPNIPCFDFKPIADTYFLYLTLTGIKHMLLLITHIFMLKPQYDSKYMSGTLKFQL